MLKKIFFTLIIITSFSCISLYSQNALELAIYGSGGINFSFPSVYNAEFLRVNAITNYPVKNVNASYQTGIGFNISGALQFGYYLDFYAELSGISILLDLGGSYIKTGYSTIFQNTPDTADTATTRYSDTIIYQSDYITGNAGLLFKLHFFKNFAFGIGGGVKLSFLEENILLALNKGGDTNVTEKTYTKPATTLINPYVKITAEYNIFFSGDWSVRIGIFGDLDLGQLLLPQKKVEDKTLMVTVGASLGVGYLFRFNPN